MELAVVNFPYRKLKTKKYLMIEILLHLEFKRALKFMWSVSRDGRQYIET